MLKELSDKSKNILTELPGNVFGEIISDIIESLFAKGVAACQKRKLYGNKVEEAVERFKSIKGGEEFLAEIAALKPSTKKRSFKRGEAKAIACEAYTAMSDGGITKWADNIIAEIGGKYPNELKEQFRNLITEIEGAAADYWRKLLDEKSEAVVMLLSRTVSAENEALKEELKGELRSYLFSSAPNTGAIKNIQQKTFSCSNCGAALDAGKFAPSAIAGLYGCKCSNCNEYQSFAIEYTDEGAEWKENFDGKLDEISAAINKAIETRNEQIAGLKKRLSSATQKEFIDESEVLDCANKLLEYCPDDVLGKFYALVSSNAENPKPVNEYLNNLNPLEYDRETITEIISYLTNPVEPRMEKAISGLIERAEQDGRIDKNQAEEYKEIIRESAEWELNLDGWDLFVAYSSRDLLLVTSLVNALKRKKISCFAAYKDLQHGRGAAGQDYWEKICKGLDDSKGLLFVSTPNSRSVDCDAISRVNRQEGELKYFHMHDKKTGKPRFRLEFNPSNTREDAPEEIVEFLKQFFGTITWCTTTDEVVNIASRHFHPSLYLDSHEDRPEVPPAQVKPQPKPEVKPAAPPAQKTPAAVTPAEKQKAEAQESKSEVKPEPKPEVKPAAPPAQVKFQPKPEVKPAAPPAQDEQNKPLQATPLSSFIIDNGVLEEFIGKETEVVIPQRVKAIGSGAFWHFSGLKSITIPEGVKSIGAYAFDGCSELTSITIPNSVKSIGNWAFCDCSGLKSITIPEGVKSIGDEAFAFCRGLTSITIPEGVKSIGEKAFYGCSGLPSITIPEGVKSIGYTAFGFCSGLTSITVTAGNAVYRSENNCIIEKKTDKLISGCQTSIIPKGVESIASGAFYGCSGLTSITIPRSVESIGDEAFAFCRGLTRITVTAGNAVYRSENNCIIEKKTGKLILGCQTSIIPSSVESIASGAFFGCSGLKSITIPKGVTSIFKNAFVGCSGLKSITVSAGNAVYRSENNCIIEKKTDKLILCCQTNIIPSSVESIGPGAFAYCDGLTSITIPEGVKYIGCSAFDVCSGLTSITIPSSVETIGDYAFFYCNGLTDITIPSSVKSIGKGAFDGCSELTSITISEGVKSIGYAAFYGCSGLTSITIPSSVKSIGCSAFEGCNRLTSITIPSSVKSIGQEAFFGCSGLKSITIPSSVKSIGPWAFGGRSGLKEIRYQGSRIGWMKIKKGYHALPKGVKIIYHA